MDKKSKKATEDALRKSGMSGMPSNSAAFLDALGKSIKFKAAFHDNNIDLTISILGKWS